MKPKLIIICGPTGVGKTEISIQLAKALNGEIIVADSQAVLKDFDIGTAKPTREEQREVPHHLINVVKYGDRFDAASFSKLADKVIQEILSRHKQPVISGGTGLYLKALLYGLMEAPKRDEKFRKQLEQRIEVEGLETLYQDLKKIDPIRANEIHPNDAVRVIRGLELYHLTGKLPSNLASVHQFQEEKYEALKIGLKRPREELYERIDKRVLQMIESGWVGEVKELLEKGILFEEKKSHLQPIGYSVLIEYLSEKISFNEGIERIQKETRQLAKRQMTWFRADKAIRWFSPDQLKEILVVCKNFLL